MDTLKGLLDSGEESEKNDEENEEDLGADPAQRSKQLRYWATLLHWWSPYPEVRAVTDPFDDENQCALTWRAVLLGIIWVGSTRSCQCGQPFCRLWRSAGMFISGLFILAVFYTNNYTTWLPINDNRLYDNSGNVYDVTKILTNYLFDEQKYQNYSPPE
ncbi:Oligopeptide transporter 2 [Yarrowia lipolytica]|nr:Oligopeptide transporter 2 [Yarrowia lipolytica]